MFFRWFCFAFYFLLFVLRLELVNARHLNQKFVEVDSITPNKTIVVDPSGYGNFRTIQSAIDSVPSNNNHWISINVKAGTYRERINIPKDKPHIILQGEGKMVTMVEWDNHAELDESATFTINANNTVVKSIGFRNSYNNPINGNKVLAAVAAQVSGDECYFNQVGFYGMQDTLWDDRGRHHYKFCTIQGAVDFIFGTGQSLFEECSISVIDGALREGISGYITAQGRTSEDDPSGFVFKGCKVFGNGTTYLGRPWREYARVLFYKTTMSNVVLPPGWDRSGMVANVDHVTFAEYGSSGSGSNMSKRVTWANKLDLATIEWMASTNFIDSAGWFRKLRI